MSVTQSQLANCSPGCKAGVSAVNARCYWPGYKGLSYLGIIQAKDVIDGNDCLAVGWTAGDVHRQVTQLLHGTFGAIVTSDRSTGSTACLHNRHAGWLSSVVAGKGQFLSQLAMTGEAQSPVLSIWV